MRGISPYSSSGSASASLEEAAKNFPYRHNVGVESVLVAESGSWGRSRRATFDTSEDLAHKDWETVLNDDPHKFLACGSWSNPDSVKGGLGETKEDPTAGSPLDTTEPFPTLKVETSSPWKEIALFGDKDDGLDSWLPKYLSPAPPETVS